MKSANKTNKKNKTTKATKKNKTKKAVKKNKTKKAKSVPVNNCTEALANYTAIYMNLSSMSSKMNSSNSSMVNISMPLDALMNASSNVYNSCKLGKEKKPKLLK